MLSASVLCFYFYTWFQLYVFTPRFVDGVTYGFVANELSHVWIRGRRAPLPTRMSRAIEDKLRSTGNTCTHSEKLALAYALLKGETEVVIFKNIRMCSVRSLVRDAASFEYACKSRFIFLRALQFGLYYWTCYLN